MVGGVRGKRPGERGPPDRVRCRHESVGLICDPRGCIAAGRSAVCRVVLEAAVIRRVVRWGDDDPVGPVRVAGGTAVVVAEDGVGDRRGGGVAAVGVDHHGDALFCEHFECRHPGWFGEGVGVASDEQWPADPVDLPVVDDCPGCRCDVQFVERRVERRTSMPRRPERNPLAQFGRVGPPGVVRGDEVRHVDQVFVRCESSSAFVHASEPTCARSAATRLRPPCQCERLPPGNQRGASNGFQLSASWLRRSAIR